MDTKNKRILPTSFFRDQAGIALPLTIIFLGAMLLLGIWTLRQTEIAYKITGAIKQYTNAFYLADGAFMVTANYLKNHAPLPRTWNPTGIEQDTESTTLPLPTYFESENDIQAGKLIPKLRWMGYDETPLPGWMLNWQGYSNFYRVNYLAKGKGKTSQNHTVEVEGLVMRIIR